jgi:cephalosporin-C deacetylase-like acetyl esterase
MMYAGYDMLTRREWLAIAAATGLRADSTNDAAELWNYFERDLTAHDERRRRKLSEIRTPADLAALQQNAQRTLAAGIGDFPDRTPLYPRPVGEIVRPDYVIEKLIFESRPGFFVTANVYRPKSTARRRPAVVQTCGHYMEGKATVDYATACAALAMKGFVALIFDPWGQGERITLRDAAGKPAFKSATGEHILAGGPGILLGRTLANYLVWDIIRAIDYLESRPDVNAGRMGLFGHSGGGMMTLLTAPIEPRIRAAMSCCAVTSFYHKTQALLMADPEQIVPGVYAQGIDHPELIAAVAPRAFLIGAVLRDFVPLAGTRRTLQEVKPIFELAGVPGNVDMVESDNEHMLDKNLREACYGWMLKHLAGEFGNTREPEIRVEPESALWCTKTGYVMDTEGARSVFDLNREEARRLGAARNLRPPVPPNAIQHRLGIDALGAPESGIHVPRTMVHNTRDVLLILAAAQGHTSAGARQLADQFTAAGFSVLSVDLRGWGETTPHPPGKNAKFSWDEFFAWRSFELGRPLLGMRTTDLLAVSREMAATYRKIYLIGIEAGGLVALHAAALDPSVAGVAAWRTLTSWTEVVGRHQSTEPVSSFVPGALQDYDIPDLILSLAPRPVVMIDPSSVDPAARILKELHLL